MSLRHAVLGFLTLAPMSGYDLKHAFDESVGHFWSADQAQIYRTLRGLVEEGLADVVEVAQEGRPDRRDHHVTPTGTAALDAWLRDVPEPAPVREPFLLQVFFAERLGDGDVRRLLAERIDAAQDLLAELEALARELVEEFPDAAGDLGTTLRLATLDNGIAHARAELLWARDVAARVDVIAGDSG